MTPNSPPLSAVLNSSHTHRGLFLFFVVLNQDIHSEKRGLPKHYRYNRNPTHQNSFSFVALSFYRSPLVTIASACHQLSGHLQSAIGIAKCMDRTSLSDSQPCLPHRNPTASRVFLYQPLSYRKDRQPPFHKYTGAPVRSSQVTGGPEES